LVLIYLASEENPRPVSTNFLAYVLKFRKYVRRDAPGYAGGNSWVHDLDGDGFR